MLPRLAIGFALLFALNVAQGQTSLRWNEDRVSWVAPTACSDGSPIGNCPITGYRVETAATQTATTWSTVTTTAATVTSHLVTGVTEGPHCYRVLALSGTRVGLPSNVACDTATPPAPGAPTLGAIDTVAYEMRSNDTVVARVGLVPLGAACGPEAKTVAGVTYHRIPVSAADLINWPTSMRITDVWARCG